MSAIRNHRVIAIICARYEAGESSAALAQEFGCVDTTILGLLRANGVSVRRRGTPEKTERNAALIKALADGVTQAAAARELGVSKQNVWRIVRRLRRTMEANGQQRGAP